MGDVDDATTQQTRQRAGFTLTFTGAVSGILLGVVPILTSLMQRGIESNPGVFLIGVIMTMLLVSWIAAAILMLVGSSQAGHYALWSAGFVALVAIPVAPIAFGPVALVGLFVPLVMVIAGGAVARKRRTGPGVGRVDETATMA